MVRAHRGYMVAAALLVMLPAIALGIATYLRPELVLSVVTIAPPPSSSICTLRPRRPSGGCGMRGNDWTMFGFYIMNNIGIAFQCYVTGVVFGLGSLFYLVSNGVFGGRLPDTSLLAAMARLLYFHRHSLGIRGDRDRHLRRRRIAHRAQRSASRTIAAAVVRCRSPPRETSSIVFGASVMLVIAAAIEAFWSSAAWVSPQAKLACAAACWILVILFFVRRPSAA